MSTQKHCPGCGTEVSQGQPHCPRCGKDLAAVFGQATGPITPAGGMAPVGGARPWPFSSEVLAGQLVALNLVQKAVVDGLVAESGASGRSLPTLLLEKRILGEAPLRDAMSRIFGLPVADLRSVQMDPALIKSFPSEMARRHMFLPLHREDTRLLMVVADPTNAQAVRDVKNTLRLTIDLRLATLTDLAPVVHQYFSPTIVVLLPSGETFAIPLSTPEIKIGKADHNDVVLPDPAVSGTHAVVRAVGDAYQIVDLGSRNGVYVDNVRVEGGRALKNGDVIAIGQCLLTFKLPVPEAAASSAGSTQILMPGQIPNALRAMNKNVGVGMPTPLAVPVVVPTAPGADEGDKKKKKKEKEKEKEKGAKEKGKESEKLKSAWIGFVGRIVAQIVGAAATIILGLAVAGRLPACSVAGGGASSPTGVVTTTAEPLNAVAFGEMNPATDMEFNASGVVGLADSKFLFVENNTNDALFELSLNADGSKSGSIVRHPIVGLAAGVVDDMEGLTLADEGGKRFIIATSSMMKKLKKGADVSPPSALLRMTMGEDGKLSAEQIPGIREWFLQHVTALRGSSDLEPDKGGLNVEGLAWDPNRKALLFGVRTPSDGGRPLIVPVRIKDISGAWTVDNLEAMEPIRLNGGGADAGVRSIEFDSSRNAFLVMLGNSTSASKAPFELYTWDGSDAGTLTKLQITFNNKMKPEGVAHGSIGGKGATLITDDAGGFLAVLD